MTPRHPSPRAGARRVTLQALYQWQMTGQSPHEVEAQFLSDAPLERVDTAYFQELFRNIPLRVEALDEVITPILDRPFAQLDPIERAILRIGAFELSYRREVPWRVVINEAVELAKTFGAEQSHRFVNGVLDKIAQAVRADETKRT